MTTRRLMSMLFAVLGVGCLALASCNTVEGAGKDVQAAGEAIEDAADDD